MNPVAAAMAASIPFRDRADVAVTDVFAVLGTTLALLALALVTAFVAWRRGWLGRWGAAPAAAKSPGEDLRIERALRLSPRTVVFRIVDGERRFLLVESRDGVRVLPTSSMERGGDLED